MKAPFVDGPAEGEIRTYPYASSTIEMRERVPDPSGQALAFTFKRIQYVKFATDHARRPLFGVNK